MPKFEVLNWHGIGAPKGTPNELVNYLHKEVVKVLNTADIKTLLAAQGVEPSGNTPDEFQKLVMERGPFIEVVNPPNPYASRTTTHNFFMDPTAHWHLEYVWKE